jgi:hypothetical protein
MRIARITIAFIAVLILTGYSFIVIKGGATAKDIKYNATKLESLEDRLKNTNVEIKQLNIKLNNKASETQKTIDEQNQQVKQLKDKAEELEKQVQAKKDREEKLRIAAENVANTLTATETVSAAPIAYSGSHEDWMAAAGIAKSDYAAVDYIVSHEGGWSGTTLYNTQGSGAYGLCQSLPASKMASAGDDYMTNPVTQLKWCASYASTCEQWRYYCGWQGAYQFWQANKWW